MMQYHAKTKQEIQHNPAKNKNVKLDLVESNK